MAATTAIVPSKTIPDSQNQKGQKNYALWIGTYIYGLYKEVLPLPLTRRPNLFGRRVVHVGVE